MVVGGIVGPIGIQPDWTLHLRDDKHRSFVSYRKGAFSGVMLNTWYYQCVNGLKWEQPWVNDKLLPRKACWLTLSKTFCPYIYGGHLWANQCMPGWFREMTVLVAKACGLDESNLPNSCNANFYESGNEVVGWHADNEPLFQATKQDALIISLSLGATRTFAYRLNAQPSQVFRLPLGDGDICTMEGLMQKHYKHAILKEGSVQASRINLTWRWIV